MGLVDSKKDFQYLPNDPLKCHGALMCCLNHWASISINKKKSMTTMYTGRMLILIHTHDAWKPNYLLFHRHKNSIWWLTDTWSDCVMETRWGVGNNKCLRLVLDLSAPRLLTQFQRRPPLGQTCCNRPWSYTANEPVPQWGQSLLSQSHQGKSMLCLNMNNEMLVMIKLAAWTIND